jgi:DNA-binding protein Fis
MLSRPVQTAVHKYVKKNQTRASIDQPLPSMVATNRKTFFK